MRGIYFVLSCLVVGSFTGCKTINIARRYSGNLSLSKIDKVTDLTNELVSIRVYQSTENYLNKVFTVTSTKTNKKLMQSMTASNFSYQNTFDLEIPDLQKEPFHLKPSQTQSLSNCFNAQDHVAIEMCVDEESISLTVISEGSRRLYLYGAHFTSESPLKFEIPQKLTITQAVQIALQKNAEVLEERENLYRAEQSALQAYADLAPQLNIKSLIDGATDYPARALGAVIDFIPFIFPSKWVHAENEEWQFRAERMADLLLKADTAASIHTLAINYINHREYTKELKNFQKQMEDLFSNLHLPDVNQTQIDMSRLKLTRMVLKSEELLEHDRMSLAFLIGLNNPNAITDIEEDETNTTTFGDDPKDAPLDEMKKYYANLAIMNSFEIRQFIYLKKASENNESNLFVNWLDPKEHISQIGFDILPELRTEESYTRGFDLKIHKTQRALAMSAFRTTYDLNQNKKYYSIYQEDLRLKRLRLDSAMNFKDQKKIIDTEGVLHRVKQRISSIIRDLKEIYRIRALIQIDQAILQKTALQGPYAELIQYMNQSTDQFLQIAPTEPISTFDPGPGDPPTPIPMEDEDSESVLKGCF